MIGILLNDDAYEQDIRELMMAFFPGETFVHEYQDGLNLAVKGTLSDDRRTFALHVISFGEPQFFAFSELKLEPEMREERRAIEGEQPIEVDYDNRFETKNKIKRRLYLLLMERTGKQLPWGTLTGIRPTKIALTKLEQGEAENEIRREMKETYYTGNEKINLSIEIAQKERELLSGIDYRDGYSLYVGIPFCPTTCLYCSFTSYPIGRWQGKMDQYFEALFKELDYVAEKKRGCRLETIYFGGGTPTSLSPEDLDRLITKIENTFDLSHVQEFTVEAGRPDSITREKLQVLRDHGIT